MPYQSALPTWVVLNEANFASPSGMADPITGFPYYAGGLNQGDYFDLTNSEARANCAPSVGTLAAGRYRYVKVDSGATAANVKTGTIGLMPSLAALGSGTLGNPSENTVTSYDQALATGLRPVVFLNAITPGNYGFVQELGIATVLGGSVLQKAAPAPGDIINSAATGVVDDPTTQTMGTLFLGKAIDLPVAGGKFRVQLNLPVVQE